MPKLEPTYLRYVYDGLNKGSLNAENASALPQGFIGLFEQEFTQKTPVSERKKVLNQLALWALFKGPVSANLALAVLELEEEQMKDLVDIYSSWFNSPESGKYQLYHERLRVYLLQKLKAEEVQALNEKLISFLEEAVKQAKGEEDEYYALEHLHQHMALESQLGNHYERLHGYVNQESLWRRQIQLSKGYAWSQNAVHQGIKEGARRKHEMNTIRSTVNSVKLMTQEQNSAEDILNLLNEGDYLAALKRAETWEGERQFKLYLLFIHELTIGTSSEADFRKEACKAVLEAIDETPEDHSVLDWCKFYSELAIYNYHEELLNMELDGMVIWKRGGYNLSELINREDVNIYTMKTLASEITDLDLKSIALARLSRVLMEQGEKEESQKILERSIQIATALESLLKRYAFGVIAISLKKHSKKLIKETLRAVSVIADEIERIELHIVLIKVLFEIGEKEESKKLVEETLLEFSEIEDEIKITDEYLELIRNLIKALSEIGEKEESKRLVQEFIELVFKITDAADQSVEYRLMIEVLLKNGYVEESLGMVSKITNRRQKSMAYSIISKSLFDQGAKNESEKMMKESIQIANDLDKWDKSIAYRVIAINLNEIKNVDIEENIRLCSEMESDMDKLIAIREISKILLEQGKMKESLSLAADIKSGSERLKAFTEFGKKLAFRAAQSLVPIITSEENQSAVIKGMSENIYEQMKLSEAIYPYLYHHSKYTQNLSNILFHQAKMACFFEEERNEEKLDMLSEVLDIKDWRRISAGA